jgi:hypothetical protein
MSVEECLCESLVRRRFGSVLAGCLETTTVRVLFENQGYVSLWSGCAEEGTTRMRVQADDGGAERESLQRRGELTSR